MKASNSSNQNPNYYPVWMYQFGNIPSHNLEICNSSIRTIKQKTFKPKAVHSQLAVKQLDLNFENYAKLVAFYKWLRDEYKQANGKPFKSGNAYCKYVFDSVTDGGLTLADFFKESFSKKLSQIFEEVTDSTSFKARSLKLQTSMSSGFKAYILFHQTKNLHN